MDDKATMANEVWDFIRVKTMEKYDARIAEEIIVHLRGKFEPELKRYKKDSFEESDPIPSTEEEIYSKTRSLVQRKWTEIKYFITQEPEKYQGIPNIEPITLQDFHLIMIGSNNERERTIVREFGEYYAHNKYE